MCNLPTYIISIPAHNIPVDPHIKVQIANHMKIPTINRRQLCHLQGWGSGEWSELRYCPRVVAAQQKHLQLLMDAGEVRTENPPGISRVGWVSFWGMKWTTT